MERLVAAAAVLGQHKRPVGSAARRLPAVKVVLPDGRELWGEVREAKTWVRIPGTTIDAPLREMAELMDRAITWENYPPTATLVQR